MRGLFVASIAIVLAVAMANCPNSCSGAGTCGADDKCTCYPNYQGLDCSERVCPFQIGFADVASADNVAHAYMECSGKGICDRKSGTCKCFAGYEGEACRRTVCPNSCSGHGTCELMSEIAADASQAAGGASGRVFNTWESAKHQVCKCDPYWGGVDCAKRQCPKGDDPLTTAGVAEKQTVTVTDGNDHATNDATGFFTLTFVDKFNGVWTTRPIAAIDADDSATAREWSAKEVQGALNGLPNQVIKGAVVTHAASGNDNVYTVTFSNTYNPGQQNLLSINIAGCTVNGCNPKFAGIGGGGSPAGSTARSVAGTKESAECSNRGSCDYATGLCACHSGYMGEACNKQTVLQ